jgi:hypothetical protein
MKTPCSACFLLVIGASAIAADPALTIYNQGFAVVREAVSLDLKEGINEVQFSGVTAHLEPQSVILRDPSGSIPLKLREQNYRNDPISQGLLLALSEGKTLEFVVKEPAQPDRIVQGKVIRSGNVMHPGAAMQSYGRRYADAQMAMAYGDGGMGQPIIEVDGKLQFSLPGMPRFPALTDEAILKPTLTWQLEAPKAAKLEAELCYITGGMRWEADYNVIAPEQGDVVELIGLVTMDNQSGKTFPKARLKLLAGDVRKLSEEERARGARNEMAAAMADPRGLPVSQKAFDEYHLYTIAQPTTLRDRETKQIEFVRAVGIQARRIYVYDGVEIDPQRWGRGRSEGIRTDADYGTQSNPKVWVMGEFENTAANHLGIALPRGEIRFYRRDGAQLQFTGENVIDHTAKGETVRVPTGHAFDLVGERKRTNFKVDSSSKWVDETFQIKVRNRKKEPVEIRVVEHLYRGANWELRQNSNTFLKTDAQTIEFRIPLQPDGEETITYTAHYSW